MRTTLPILGVAVGLAAIAAIGAGGWFYSQLRASLPLLDGALKLEGLSAPASVDRDALGAPTVRAATRLDVARTLGFLHAQDRFFQMDLLRRRAAGELAELFGARAVGFDRSARIHGFRRLAREDLARSGAAERALVEAYTAGVNSGLAALRSRPFEYLVLRTVPKPWAAEDCALIGYAMTLTLQQDQGQYERALTVLRDTYGTALVESFAATQTPEDAALDGSRGGPPPLPPEKLVDLRRRATPPAGSTADGAPPGSNAFALSGAHTASGSALLANDMHLELGVPTLWYRASMEWPGHRLAGVTLPGTPLLVAGSNGRVAWGFTHACADTGDLVMVTPSDSPGIYRAPEPRNLREVEKRTDTIRVKGGKDVTVESDWTMWGPIVGRDVRGHPLAYRWTAHDPGAINFALLGMEDAATVDDAVAVAHRCGIPAQNILVADASGRIAWTIAGFLPKRKGFDGRLPVSWIFGDRGWDGTLPPDEVPVVSGPSRDVLWTANNRAVGGEALQRIGDGGYERPERAGQIRDDLAALAAKGPAAKPADLLSIQLDDRALFLSRWQRFMTEVLTPEVTGRDASRANLRSLIERWDNRASVGSVSYRLVREFRRAVCARVLDPLFAPCVEAYPAFRWSLLNYEDPVWAIVHARPVHLLPSAYATWDELFAAAADDVVKTIRSEGTELSGATWGRRNTLRILHPFSGTLPRIMTSWLNMPAEAVPGDADMPRVQAPAYGASVRFAVSPGHEEEGILEMPGGESGHPLSPFFRAGHEAWVRGDPTPFLPGPSEHRLTLQP